MHALADREVHFTIWDRRLAVIADTFADGSRVGESATPWGAGILTFVFEGNSRVCAFDEQHAITRFGSANKIEPHLGVVTPIRDSNGQVVAALLVHDDESREKASRILRMIRLGESGETYVFARDGVMLSESRFNEQLREIGLISREPDSYSTRTVRLRDPGGDLTKGFVPDEPLSARPLTKMARLCTAGNDGDDLEGYRDYRGVEVIGAWRWIDELEVGLATELDVDEAEPGLRILLWLSWLILGLIGLCTGIAFLSYCSVLRLRQQIGENRKLGNYTLEKKIGEGGMGAVFQARHELLSRPTAVKLLKPEFVDKESTLRFEREARLASSLEHPNTVRIYDYGMTPEGLFYLVMELLNGVSMDELVEGEKSLSSERTVYLLRQICASLREAHDAGLVHRDLKPSNIMVCRRGGEFDVVKVLDFGLVKQLQSSASNKLTSTALVAGTPQYMAPERLRDPGTDDRRSDIYSIGAVGFFLLTGRNLVEGESLAEILLQVVDAPPCRPSDCVDTDIPAELDELIFRCLAKDPEDRPASAAELVAALDGIEVARLWTPSKAKAWWDTKPEYSQPQPSGI